MGDRRIALAALVIFAVPAFAPSAQAASCRDGKSPELIPANDPVVSFPGQVADGEFAHAGGNTWSSFPSFPADESLDAITLTGTSEVCWWQGFVSGPMKLAQDADTYYECPPSDGWEEHGYPGTGPCLPYHTTAAHNPENTSGTIVYENHSASGFGDGISLDEPLPLGTDVIVRGSYFNYIHDDVLEDDHCSVDWVFDDGYVARAFMFLATDRAGTATCGSGTARTATINNSWIRLFRFTHAYKERPGHGGLWKPDDGVNPVKTITSNKILLGPVAGDQSIFPPLAEVAACLGNVVLWDGTNAAYADMLADKSNGTNLTALNATFPGCFTVVKREDRGGTGMTSAQFLNLSLPELGNKSWNQGTDAWYSAHFPTGCGIGAELALVVPLLVRLRRRAMR